MSHRIVFTGAPGSGKTAILTWLRTRASFREWVTFPELARQLLELDPGWRDRWHEWHREIYERTIAREAAIGDRSFLSDRGTVDTFAFHPETVADRGTSLEREYARYSTVVLLETAAHLGPSIYAPDAIRTEDATEAIRLEQLHKRVWLGHPDLIIVPTSVSWALKCHRVEAALRSRVLRNLH